jgi:hypothetical protein
LGRSVTAKKKSAYKRQSPRGHPQVLHVNISCLLVDVEMLFHKLC